MPAISEQRPTLEYVSRVVKDMEEVWGPAWTRWDTYDEYYWRTFKVWDDPAVAEARSSLRPGKLAQIIDHAVDTRLSYDPKCHRVPVGRGEEAAAAADRVEKATARIFQEMMRRDTGLTWKQVGKHLLLNGHSVVEGVTLDPLEMAYRAQRPSKQKGESQEEWELRESQYDNEEANFFPYRIFAAAPKAVLIDPSRKMPLWAVVRKQKYAYDVEALSKYKVKTRKYAQTWERGEREGEKVLLTEFWSKYWHWVAVQAGEQVSPENPGTELYSERNVWGYVPFAHAFAGFGGYKASQYGIEPSTWAIGLGEHVLDLIKAQARRFSGNLDYLMDAVYAKVRWAGKEPAEAAQELEGEIINAKAEEIGYWERGNLPQSLFETGIEVDREIERSTYSMQAAGFREEGVVTVGQQAILSTAVDKKFRAVSEQVNHLATIMGQNLLRLVDVLGEPVKVGEDELTPEDIGHNYNIGVKFEVLDPILEMQQAELSLREHAQGLLDDEGYWTKRHVEDVAGMKRGLLEDKVRKHPVTEAKLVAATAVDMRVVKTEEEWGEMEGQLAGAGEPPASQGRPLRQPLTPQVVKPAPRGA